MYSTGRHAPRPGKLRLKMGSQVLGKFKSIALDRLPSAMAEPYIYIARDAMLKPSRLWMNERLSIAAWEAQRGAGAMSGKWPSLRSRAITLACFGLRDCFNLDQSASFKRESRSTCSIRKMSPAGADRSAAPSRDSPLRSDAGGRRCHRPDSGAWAHAGRAAPRRSRRRHRTRRTCGSRH